MIAPPLYPRDGPPAQTPGGVFHPLAGRRRDHASFSLKKHWLNLASDAAGIFYPPSFLFLIGMLFILLILIHGKFYPASLRNG